MRCLSLNILNKILGQIVLIVYSWKFRVLFKKKFIPFIAGPCALEFTKLKTKDHYWTDPPADELVQRHRISSYVSPGVTSPANRRPGLHVSYIVFSTVYC